MTKGQAVSTAFKCRRNALVTLLCIRGILGCFFTAAFGRLSVIDRFPPAAVQSFMPWGWGVTQGRPLDAIKTLHKHMRNESRDPPVGPYILQFMKGTRASCLNDAKH